MVQRSRGSREMKSIINLLKLSPIYVILIADKIK